MINKDYSPFKPPANFWSHSWFNLIQLFINGICKSSLIIASYYIIRELTKQIKLNESIDSLSLWILVLISLFLVSLRIHERYVAENMSQKYINRIRSNILKRIMRASIRDVQNKSIGNLSSRLAGDLNALKRWLSLGISRLITHSLLLVIIVAFIGTLNFKLAIYITLSLTILISLSVYFGNRLKYTIRNVRKNRIKIHSLIVERLSSISTIRIMGKESREIKKINRQAKLLEQNISKQGILLGVLRGIGDASSFVLVIVFFGFQLLHPNDLSLENITALISIILFLNSPIRELGRIQEYYQGAKISLMKVTQLYRIPRIIRGKSSMSLNSHPCGSIEIKRLKLKSVFNNHHFIARPNEHIAIIGSNGSGKSTLIEIIMGLIKPDSGIVRVNGINPCKYSPTLRSQNIGVCSVNTQLIRSSLYKNLTYRTKNFTQIEFNELLSFCQLNTLVNDLNKGLSTLIHEKAQNLSSGEIARVSLFRALLGHPKILILDEPESYMDSKGLSLIKKILVNYKGTVLIATHNRELISLCDEKWKLNHSENQPTEQKTTQPYRLIN